jgi:conjugal transfer mating pair stabilization protein TraN
MAKGGPETRVLTGPVEGPELGKPIIDSEPISRDSWVEAYTYSCLKKVEGNCQSLRSKGCTQISSECAEVMGAVCVAWKQTFKCPSAKRTTTRYKTMNAKSPFCLSGDCTNSDYEANGELLNAMSHLAILKEAQNDVRANVGIFKGQVRKCSKNCAGFRDCCTTGKGWGVSLNLAACSGEEQELGRWREKKRCVFVGTYCAEKILGRCTRKKSSYCCFGNKLSKLLNDQGKRQLGIGLGDAKSPDCRGLTPEELSRIDMSKMDLSELYEEVQANFKPQPQAHMAKGVELERIKENMARLTGRVQAPAEAKAPAIVPASSGCRVPNCPLCKKS